MCAGPSLVARTRPDLLENYSEFCDYQLVADYIYHCNAQKPRSVDLSRNLYQLCTISGQMVFKNKLKTYLLKLAFDIQ